MTTPTSKPTKTKVPAKLIVALVVLAVAIVFILQNRQVTNIYLLTATLSSPLWTALTGVFVLGGIVGFLLRRGKN